MKKHRPRILTFLNFGAGGTITIAMVYLFRTVFLEQTFSSPAGWLLVWWFVSGLGAVFIGPFKVFEPKHPNNKDR